MPPDLNTAGKIIATAFARGIQLGIGEREMATAALGMALSTAEKHGDPDGYAAKLVALAKQKGHL